MQRKEYECPIVSNLCSLGYTHITLGIVRSVIHVFIHKTFRHLTIVIASGDRCNYISHSHGIQGILRSIPVPMFGTEKY